MKPVFLIVPISFTGLSKDFGPLNEHMIQEFHGLSPAMASTTISGDLPNPSDHRHYDFNCMLFNMRDHKISILRASQYKYVVKRRRLRNEWLVLGTLLSVP